MDRRPGGRAFMTHFRAFTGQKEDYGGTNLLSRPTFSDRDDLRRSVAAGGPEPERGR
jgi:hypothetical protein